MSIAQKILSSPQKYSVQELTQGVQDGTIPAYIGVPLIQDKIQKQKQAQAMGMGQQPNQPPIAEEVLAQAAQLDRRPSGVSALASNLPQEYAGGGIVAFGDNPNQPVSLNMPSTPQSQGILGVNPLVQRDPNESFDDFKRRVLQADAARQAQQQAQNAQAREAERQSLLSQRGQLLPTNPFVKPGILSPTTAAAPTETSTATPAATAAPAPAPAADNKPPVADGIKQLLGGLGIGGQSASGRFPGMGIKPQNEFTPPAGKSMTAQTMEMLGGYEGADGYTERAAARDKLAEDAIAEARKGVKGQAYEGYQKTLEDEAKTFGADKADAKAMAIFKAGLAMMAGTSQHGLVNIGAGAMAGLEDYQAAAKDIKKAEKENRKEMSLIEQARRAEAVGDRDKAIEYIQKSSDRKDARDMHVTEALSKAYGIDRAQAYDMTKTRYTTQADLDRTNLAGQYQLAGHEIAGKYSLAGHALGAMNKDGLKQYEIARLRMEAEKRVDPNELRTTLAKQLNLSKTPAPGADKTFDARFQNAYENEIGKHVNRYLTGNAGGAGQLTQNPYAGYKMVP
jgi:hypothetical protein